MSTPDIRPLLFARLREGLPDHVTDAQINDLLDFARDQGMMVRKEQAPVMHLALRDTDRSLCGAKPFPITSGPLCEACIDTLSAARHPDGGFVCHYFGLVTTGRTRDEARRNMAEWLRYRATENLPRP